MNLCEPGIGFFLIPRSHISEKDLEKVQKNKGYSVKVAIRNVKQTLDREKNLFK